MNKIKNIILDSGREILQIIFLIICFISPQIVNLSEIIRVFLGGETPTIVTAKYYYLMLSGNWTIGCLLVLYILFTLIRKSNKEKTLNKGNIYHIKPYWWYWICSKILGYEKCSLVLVPIYIQFKLILKDTFNEYPLDESMFPEEECEVLVDKNLNVTNMNLQEINLILQDTYPIQDDQIPKAKISNNTINIRRIADKVGKRIYSKNFVDTVVSEIRKLPENIILNIFSTTNPKNTYEIVKRGISLGERSNIKRVNIFQQEGVGDRAFINKAFKVL